MNSGEQKRMHDVYILVNSLVKNEYKAQAAAQELCNYFGSAVDVVLHIALEVSPSEVYDVIWKSFFPRPNRSLAVKIVAAAKEDRARQLAELAKKARHRKEVGPKMRMLKNEDAKTTSEPE